MKQITISHVAKRAGVSVGTVSAVINGKNTVKQSTKERVLPVMHELNFRPEGQARILRSRDDQQGIGLLIPGLDHPFYATVAGGV